MNHTTSIRFKTISKKFAALVMLLSTAAVTFASLGDGKSKRSEIFPRSSLLSARKALKPGTFTLKSGYVFRGNQVINTAAEKQVIRLNTTATVQKGNMTFTVPIKKNVLFDKVKIDIGNRQFQQH